MEIFFYPQETLAFNKRAGLYSRARRAHTFASPSPDMSLPSFRVKIYFGPCSFHSADHYTGTDVVTKVPQFTRRSQSTCLDVQFRSWTQSFRRVL